MRNKLILASMVLLISVFLSGCLLVDNSQSLTVEDEEEIKIDATKLTEDFFSYNEYDSTADNSGYQPEKLIEMIKEQRGSVLTINPIIGYQYNKSYTNLVEEIRNQTSIFAAQKEYDYKLLFENRKGNDAYKLLLNEGNYTDHTATYEVLFQVFEEVEGKRLLTDNGIITFELIYENGSWFINHLTIDYRKLGEIKLE